MFKVFCPSCGSLRPDGSDSVTCVPCSNRGHYYRLVTSDTDRRQRLRVWFKFYKTFNYSRKERRAIPHYLRLAGVLKG